MIASRLEIAFACFVVAVCVFLIIAFMTIAFGQPVEPFDIEATGPDVCGPLSLIAWSIQSDMPGHSLDPNGPLGVGIGFHSFQCTEGGIEAIFHVEPSTDIVGLCLTQPGCSDECADLFPSPPALEVERWPWRIGGSPGVLP